MRRLWILLVVVGCAAKRDTPAPRQPAATPMLAVTSDASVDGEAAVVDAGATAEVVAVDVVTEPTFPAKHTPTACVGNPQGMELWLDEIAPACPPQPFIQVLHDYANAIPDLCDGPCPRPCKIVRDGGERTSKLSYDDKGRWTEITPMLNSSAEGTADTCTYNERGRASCTESLSMTPDIETVKRDAKGRIIEIVGERQSIRFKYDQAGRVIRATAPVEGTSTYGYDGRGRLVSETSKLGGRVSYKYDAKGRLVAQRSIYEHVTYTYRDNRIVELEDVSGLRVMSGPTTTRMTFTYDEKGRPHSIASRRRSRANSHPSDPFDDREVTPWLTFVYDCE